MAEELKNWLTGLLREIDDDDLYDVKIDETDIDLLNSLHEEYKKLGRITSESVVDVIDKGMVNKSFFEWYLNISYPPLSYSRVLDITCGLIKNMGDDDFNDIYPNYPDMGKDKSKYIHKLIFYCIKYKKQEKLNCILSYETPDEDEFVESMLDASLIFFEDTTYIGPSEYSVLLDILLTHCDKYSEDIKNTILLNLFNYSWSFGHKKFSNYIKGRYPFNIDPLIKCYYIDFKQIVEDGDTQYLFAIKDIISIESGVLLLKSTILEDNKLTTKIVNILADTEADIDKFISMLVLLQSEKNWHKNKNSYFNMYKSIASELYNKKTGKIFLYLLLGISHVSHKHTPERILVELIQLLYPYIIDYYKFDYDRPWSQELWGYIMTGGAKSKWNSAVKIAFGIDVKK